MRNVFKRLFAVRFRIPSRHEFLHHSYKGAHTSYFAFVAMEGHGLYATAGALLCLLSILDVFMHFE